MKYFTFIVHIKNGSRKQKTIQAGCEDLAWEIIRLDYPNEYIELF